MNDTRSTALRTIDDMIAETHKRIASDPVSRFGTIIRLNILIQVRDRIERAERDASIEGLLWMLKNDAQDND